MTSPPSGARQRPPHPPLVNLRIGSAMVKLPPRAAVVPPPDASANRPAPPPAPGDLPAPGAPQRWAFLQRLRRRSGLDPQPWLEAIEQQRLGLEADLLAALAEHLSAGDAVRLLTCWLSRPPLEPEIPALIGQRRDPLWAAALRQALLQASVEQQVLLLPLLGHQRDPADFALLQHRLLQPAPLALRRAALEGLQRGLGAWPRGPLRAALVQAANDLQPALAAAAIDALARLPDGRGPLLRLARRQQDPALARRLQRRLQAMPASALLLLVHGRSGGEMPDELEQLAAELAERREAPVQLWALTAGQPPPRPAGDPGSPPPTLVPLLLLPGLHVRQDLPAVARALRQQGPLRRLPFLGAWPAWQQLVHRELASLSPGAQAPLPLLLHHPLPGPQAGRFLQQLGQRCGACCQAAGVADPPPGGRPFLPLVLAANRLTEALQANGHSEAARPLLARARLREGLIQLLEELP